jgi:c-di-GMP-binding flagellar brake protein YcgR
MAIKDLPDINQTIQIDIDRSSYSSRIEEITSNTISIALPTKGGAPVTVHPKDILRIWWQSRDAVLGFNTVVLTRKIQPIPVLVVAMPKSIDRLQRRHWVRQELDVPVALEISEEETIKTSTIDVSGGGMLISCPASLEPGQEIPVTIFLPESEIKAVIRVVRVIPHPTDNTKFQIASSFKKIAERDRDKIVKLIFDFQRKRLSKGL